jgi:hypothetical protein
MANVQRSMRDHSCHRIEEWMRFACDMLEIMHKRHPFIIRGGMNRILISQVKKALPRGVKQILKTCVLLLNGVKGRDSTESIIKDDMVLQRNLLSTRVEYQRNQQGMFMGAVNKDTLTCSTVPLLNLLSILKSSVKHVDRTSQTHGCEISWNGMHLYKTITQQETNHNHGVEDNCEPKWHRTQQMVKDQ